MLRDRRRLKKLRETGRKREFERLLTSSSDLRRSRADRVPTFRYDPDLPITQRIPDIQDAIRNNQVVVVCGETGSGKSTQLPKLCLEMGRGIDGFIGHTQPRRVAARAIAERLSEELGDEVGGHAGYKFRFAEQVGDKTYIKVVTDGTLLAELENDRRLEHYDTLIIDEAHERSLNIDFLLGVVKRLLPRRPDLRVIITSATIDPERFSRYFDGAPVIEVSGRTYPVELRYRPFDDRDGDAGERNLEVALIHAVDELLREGTGDILVFLPGEFHIHKTAGLLRRKHYRGAEILPLYARLSTKDQQRIFRPGGARRIVLATNVAETSITVPGIRYVVDSGLARISRYRPTRQVQALPVEPVSQASAKQRAGRCGREADGVCIRLYSEADYESREAFTPPEVQRTSLASVILAMHNLHLGAVERFPFIEPPPERMVKAGYRLLEELGAIDGERRLTRTGKRLARIPADPRVGRMLLAAGEYRCANEVLTIAAALSIQDPRERPAEAKEKARQAHAAYQHGKSDFLSLLNLWETYRRETREFSHRRRARYCRERFLSASRMREWRNVRDQLRRIARELNIRINDRPASVPAVHKALLTGLLGNIAQRHVENEYLGTQGKKLFIHPSSSQFKARPRWLVCAELVQTTKLYARTVAAIDPRWAEQPAAHLVKREYLEPYWDAKRGEVMAREQVSLYGLTLLRGRRTRLAPVDPATSHQVFIRQALVPGNVEPAPDFLRHNLALLGKADELEQRLRRRGLTIDDERLFEFYDQRLPSDLCDLHGLDKWMQGASAAQLQALRLDEDTVRPPAGDDDHLERFPGHLEINGNRLALRYRFEPGHPGDGVTLAVPAPLVPQLDGDRLSWLVPGLLADKITALIKALPKALRRGIGPAPDAALLCLKQMNPRDDEGLTPCLSRTLSEHRGVDISPEDWDEASLPVHLRMNIEVIDTAGEVIDRDRDLAALQKRLAESGLPEDLEEEGRPSWVRDGLKDWSFDDLPEAVDYRRSGINLRAYPALEDRGDSVAIELYDRERSARDCMAAGIRRLLRLKLAGRITYLRKNLPDAERMCLNFAGIGSCAGLKDDIINAALARASDADPWEIRSRGRFEAELETVDGKLVPEATEICGTLAPALDSLRRCTSGLQDLSGDSRTDIAQQLDLLVFPGFVSYTPRDQLGHIDRYLKGIGKRIERCRENPERDLARMERVRGFWKRLLMEYPPPPDPVPDELSDFRWLLEEFRISVFAQELKTARPVSEKRLEEQWRTYHESRSRGPADTH